MTIEELRQRLRQIEWNDIEFKKAQREVPKAAYDTVSAFANTRGGHLVFGVEDKKNGTFEIVGVLDPEKVQNDFLSALRGGELFSCVIATEEARMEDEGKIVLAFFIPEARREQKPVHHHGNFRNSFIRRGGGDEHCNEEELRRFIRDADPRTYDGEVLPEFDAANCFDPESLVWYRGIFNTRNPGNAVEAVDQLDFLHHFGLLAPAAQQPLSRHPTRAAILLFGNAAAIQRLMPRAIVDFRLLAAAADEVLPEERWDHRMLLEENLTKCWRRGVQFFMERIADRPFQLDAGTLHGSDAPPDYLAFRESFLNLLTHQDFGDQTRKALVTVHRDQLLFWNPGASYVSGEDLFNPGDKPVRNPRIRSMLHRIGIGEQAGSGVRAIYGNQRRLGRIPPILTNDRSDQSFRITLSKKLITSQRQQWVAQRIGVTLSDAEAAVFFQALRQETIGPLEAASVAGMNPAETGRLLERLVQQQLLEIHPASQGRSFRPKPVFQERAAALLSAPAAPVVAAPAPDGQTPTDQAAGTAKNLVTARSDGAAVVIPAPAVAILTFCQVGRSVPSIMEMARQKHRYHFTQNTLRPLLQAGLLRQTHPEQPHHPEQGYVITEHGKAFLASLVTDQAAQASSQLGHSVTDQVPATPAPPPAGPAPRA